MHNSQRMRHKRSPLLLHHHSSCEDPPNGICSPSVLLNLRCDDAPQEGILAGDQTPQIRYVIQDDRHSQHLVEWCLVTHAHASFTPPESSSRSAHAIAVLRSVGWMSCIYLSVHKNVWPVDVLVLPTKLSVVRKEETLIHIQLELNSCLWSQTVR